MAVISGSIAIGLSGCRNARSAREEVGPRSVRRSRAVNDRWTREVSRGVWGIARSAPFEGCAAVQVGAGCGSAVPSCIFAIFSVFTGRVTVK